MKIESHSAQVLLWDSKHWFSINSDFSGCASALIFSREVALYEVDVDGHGNCTTIICCPSGEAWKKDVEKAYKIIKIIKE